MFNSISIREKLIAPIIVLILIAAVSTVMLSLELVNTYEAFENLINTQLKARFISKDVSAQLSEAGRVANLALLQRDPAEYAPNIELLQSTLSRIGPDVDALRELAPKYDDSIAKARAARDAMQAAVKPTVDLKQAGKHDEAAANWSSAARAVLTPARLAMNDMADKLQESSAQAVAEQVASTDAKIRNLAIALGLLIVLVGAVALYVVLRSVVSPIKVLTGKITQLSSGDGNFELPEAARGDELGAMGKALLVFRENAEKIKAAMAAEAVTLEIGEIIDRAAKNDLTVRVDLNGKAGFLRNIGSAINQLLEGSNLAFRDISQKTRQVAVAVAEASTAVGQVSGGARSQNETVAHVAQALGESADAIRTVSNSANAANEKGIRAAQLVERGQVSAEELAQVIEKVAQNSRQISRITQVIAGIANRTHILSLNAAIEAARAGEHGKGFVVVSQEVGKLAESAAQNARQITDIVEQATADAVTGATASLAVKQTMDSIASEVSQTSQMIRSIAVAMEQQQTMVTQIEGNLTDLRGIASGNAVAAEEITATMIQLSQLAEEQRSQVDMFKVA